MTPQLHKAELVEASLKYLSPGRTPMEHAMTIYRANVARPNIPSDMSTPEVILREHIAGLTAALAEARKDPERLDALAELILNDHLEITAQEEMREIRPGVFGYAKTGKFDIFSVSKQHRRGFSTIRAAIDKAKEGAQ